MIYRTIPEQRKGRIRWVAQRPGPSTYVDFSYTLAPAPAIENLSVTLAADVNESKWFQSMSESIRGACHSCHHRERLCCTHVEITKVRHSPRRPNLADFGDCGQRFVDQLFERESRVIDPFPSAWRTSTVLDLMRLIRQQRDFESLPILADALEEAGCNVECALSHCRGGKDHGDQCWVINHLWSSNQPKESG